MAESVPVTAVIPAWNAEAWLQETVDSILAQTRPPEAVIVIDDGSTDGTADCLRTRDERVTVVTQANAGVSAARNEGTRRAVTEWVAYCDADDLWMPRKLEAQWALAEAEGDRVAAVYSGLEAFEGEGRSLWSQRAEGGPYTFEGILRHASDRTPPGAG